MQSIIIPEHDILVSLPEVITTAAEARSLAKLIEEYVPADRRASPMGSTGCLYIFMMTFAQVAAAERDQDAPRREMHEPGVVSTYPFALGAMRAFLSAEGMASPSSPGPIMSMVVAAPEPPTTSRRAKPRKAKRGPAPVSSVATADGASAPRPTAPLGWNGLPFPPHVERVVLPDGRVLEDAIIWPNFCQEELGLDPDALWAELLAIPTWPNDKEIPYRPAGDNPHWIRGAHPALHYRGNPVKRAKIWCQSDYDGGLLRYKYSGWQWPIAFATHAVESVSPVQRLLDRLNAGLLRSGHGAHNHAIITAYRDQNEEIGFHTDKDGDFAENSYFIVIKFGEPRPFAFCLPGQEDNPFFSRPLSAGTAVFVRCKAAGAANDVVKHGVPPMRSPVGLSGSIVTRCIATRIPWNEVKEKVEMSMLQKSSNTAMMLAHRAEPSELPAMPEPSEALKKAVLDAAPGVFQFERLSSGVAAVVYEFVLRNRLFERAGFDSMKDYAATRLGVSAGSCKPYHRAGAAMWDIFPTTATSVIEYVAGRSGGQLTPSLASAGLLPEIPCVSVLRELPRALRRVDPGEHDAIIQGVAAGEVTYEELHAAGRVRTGRSDGKGAHADSGTSAPVQGQARLGVPADIHIFDDVPELKGMAELLREALEVGQGVERVWTDNPGRDVDPVRPALTDVLADIKKAAKRIEDDIIPRSVCFACSGKGKRCQTCTGKGWMSRKSAIPPSANGTPRAAKAPATKTAKTAKTSKATKRAKRAKPSKKLTKRRPARNAKKDRRET